MITVFRSENNYKTMPIVYILTLLLVGAASQPCAPARYSSNLTTAILQFSPNDIQNNAYSFTFPNALPAVPQIALAITQLATSSQAALNNSQFYVLASSVTPQGVRLALNSQGSAWIVSRVCLWASTNTQLLLGAVPIQNLKPASGTASQNLQFEISVASALPVTPNQIARGFLNGLTTRGQLASVSLANVAFVPGKIRVSVVVKAGEVFQLWVSFVVFNLNNAEFTAYGNFGNVKSGESQTVDLLGAFSAVQNVFYGMSALQVDLNGSGLSLQVGIDSNFLLSYASLAGSFLVNYLFVGYPGNFTCSACKKIGRNYYSTGNVFSQYSTGDCLEQCPANTVAVTLSNGGQLCRPCPSGSGMIVVGGSCVCPELSTLQNGVCVSPLGNLKVQSMGPVTSAPSVYAPTSQIYGIVNTPTEGNINQNYNFVSANSNGPSTSTAPVFLPSGVSQPQTTKTTTVQTTIQLNQITNVFCPLANSFFNGIECTCKVGFIFQNGQCVVPGNTPGPGVVIITPNNSTPVQICPANAYSVISKDGSSSCVCNQGYTMVNNVCNKLTCPPNSTLVGSTCTCNPGFYNISGSCVPCPAGAFWSSQAQKCIYVCGVNAIYSETSKKCECNPGFGIDAGGNCGVCSSGFNLVNGYCVTCPLNNIYNSTTQTCTCKSGFVINIQGICTQKCSNSEVYSLQTATCDCVANFSRIKGTCMPCPTGSFFNNGQCTSCPSNSYLLAGKCVCSPGFAVDAFGVCQACSSLPNAFILNGLCVKCSSNQVYSATLGTCQCPYGKVWSNGLCVSTCNSDEVLDKSGNCYTCPMNEIITNGVCVCQPGYSRNSCGMCTASCPTGAFLFQGRCGTCPLNTFYMAQVGGCVCPNGSYMDPLSNTCVRSSFALPDCSSNSYYDVNAQKCTVCPSSCLTCSSSTTYKSCAKGFSLAGGDCRAVCGDGMIVGGEQCDAGQVAQAGCVQCRVSQGYTCSGQPSQCALIQPNPTNITNSTGNPSNSTTNPSVPKLALMGNVSLNSNNIFVSFTTTPTFTFPDPTTMQNFIKVSFFNTMRPSSYCVQRASPNLNIFDCLLIYPSGVPNTKFSAVFSFDYLGMAANTTVTIDPLLYATSTRNTRPTSSSSSPSTYRSQ